MQRQSIDLGVKTLQTIFHIKNYFRHYLSTLPRTLGEIKFS